MVKRKRNTKSYKVTLLDVGKIIPEVHYGPFSREWWTATESSINNQATLLVPIRIGMATLTKLNGHEFIIFVLEPDIKISSGPRYIAKCNSIISEICTNSSAAITSLYQQIFGTQTKFSGPLVMGFDQAVIVERLLNNIQFRPFEFFVERLKIFVFGVGVSNNQEWNYTGAGYQSSFIDNVNRKQILYIQYFTDKKCNLSIYEDNQLKTIICGKNPADVWSNVNYKPEFDANKLFGIDNEYTQTVISQLRIPSCTLEEWNNVHLLQQIFEYHLKKRTKSNINWMGFIENWKNKECEVIELRTSLAQLYGSNYQINSREFCAWRTMLRHIGCVEITPNNENQSKFEFWTRSSNPTKDREILETLYNLSIFHSVQSEFCDQAEIFWACIQKSLDANKNGQDGKRRILSIVADQFSYDEIKKNLNISSSDTINKARQYARLHGPGAEHVEKPVFTRVKISHEKLDQLEQFLDDKNNVIMSSYKTETKTGLPVKYLKDTKKALWEKFSCQFPDGIKQTSFMTFLQGKQYIYQEDLGGLCSICSRYGYEIFAEMKRFIEKNIQDNNLQKKYINELEHLRRYYKKDYEQEFKIAANGTVTHDTCISHCLPYAFGVCTESHTYECVKCGQLFAVFHQLKSDTPVILHSELDEYYEHLLYYLAHQTRKVYLNAQFNANLLELDENGALIVVDYKMKVLPKSARESKEQFFGKKGWTLHSVLVYTRKADSLELDIQAYDHWSNDPRQDAWFTASSLHAVVDSMVKKPEWVSIISDNGGHYHNADLMMIMRYWPEWYGIFPKKWIFLEPGEAKTTIDSHHAQIAHAINRHVKLGMDISSGRDIEDAISGICGTSVSHLEPNRKKESGKGKNKLPGISNWFEWSWPVVGEYAGCIQARDIPNLGTWTNFFPKDLEKLRLKVIEKPNPNTSIPSIPENTWTVSLPNDTGIQVKKLKKKHVKEQLEARGILREINNKKGLVKELEIALAEDTLAKISGNTNYPSIPSSSCDSCLDKNKNSVRDENKPILESSSQFLLWPLTRGWALKSVQKFGKKGSGKRISKKVWNLLQGYFLEGNVNKSERHTAESMLVQLRQNVEDGVIEEEEVPKLETIRNWISRYTNQHRQESARVAQTSQI